MTDVPTTGRVARKAHDAPVDESERTILDTDPAWQAELGFATTDEFTSWRHKVLKPLCIEWVLWSSQLKKQISQNNRPRLPSWDQFSEKLFAAYQEYEQEVPPNYS